MSVAKKLLDIGRLVLAKMNLLQMRQKNGFDISSMSIESTFHDRYEANSFKCTNRLQDFPMPVTKIGKNSIDRRRMV